MFSKKTKGIGSSVCWENVVFVFILVDLGGRF